MPLEQEMGWIFMDMLEILSRFKIKLLMERYKTISLAKNDIEPYRNYVRPFKEEISQLDNDVISLLFQITSSGIYDKNDDDHKEARDAYITLFDTLNSRTPRDLFVFRDGTFDEPDRTLYSSTIDLSIALELSNNRYKDINCLLIKKGSVVILSASFISENSDKEKEIIIDNRCVYKVSDHLWYTEPRK